MMPNASAVVPITPSAPPMYDNVCGSDHSGVESTLLIAAHAPARASAAPAQSTIAVNHDHAPTVGSPGLTRSSPDDGVNASTTPVQARTTRSAATTSLGRCHCPTRVDTPVAAV